MIAWLDSYRKAVALLQERPCVNTPRQSQQSGIVRHQQRLRDEAPSLAKSRVHGRIVQKSSGTLQNAASYL